MERAARLGIASNVGGYEIVRKLARGGMADLFLARTVASASERLVVIKKILPKLADNPRFVQLFHDEAKLAQSLDHPNIVTVFDVGGAGGELFYAMEYLHGQDVRSVLHRAWKRSAKMPIMHAVHVATRTASALHYAHEKRRPDGTLIDVVHRDVSPSNVIVGYDGAVKLLDFGVAKAATSTVKTRTGTLKGKIAYMSPEQAKGGAVDRRSDVFSLGIVLWEMITTTRLFRGENDLATLQLIINQSPRTPSEVNPDCTPELERIVLKALAQDPANRYQTALAMQQDLEEYVRAAQVAQSQAGLGYYMAVLFQSEIDSWKEAQAQGIDLSVHLTSVNAGADATAPVSESEFIEPDDEDEELDEDDLEQAAVSGTVQDDTMPTKAGRIGASTIRDAAPVPPLSIRPATLPSVIVRDQTPIPTRGSPEMLPSVLGPPNAPAEAWTPEQAARLKKQATWVGGAVVAFIVLVVIIKAIVGDSSAPPAAAKASAPVVPPDDKGTQPTVAPVATEPVAAPIDAGMAALPIDAEEPIARAVEPTPGPTPKTTPRPALTTKRPAGTPTKKPPVTKAVDPRHTRSSAIPR